MRYVVIASPRTGSSHLVHLLGAHPDIFSNGNIFDDRKTVYVFWPSITQVERQELSELRARDPEAFLEAVFARNHGRDHVGFKIFEDEGDQMLDKLITSADVKKVVLYRKNILAAYSSKLIAAKTKQYSVSKEAKKVPSPQIIFEEGEFMKYLEGYNSFYRSVIDKLAKCRQDFHFIGYDEINDAWRFTALIQFIGADSAKPLSSASQFRHNLKQNSPNILSRFSNKKAVKGFLRRQGRMDWAYEGEVFLGNFEPGEPDDSADTGEDDVGE
jgi:LPS sulfotransferase NodH